MRAFAGPAVVQIALSPVHYSDYSSSQTPAERGRQGLYPGSNLVQETTGILGSTPNTGHERILSDGELWAIYIRTPDLRAAFEAVVRVISTWDWCVEPRENLAKDSPLYDAALDMSEEADRFLRSPNKDQEVWQTWVSKSVRDLLVYDEWATENVMEGGELDELVTLPGGTVQPRVDRHQRTVDYVQATGAGEVRFSREQVLYFNLFPNSHRPGGTPLIESILNEVITLLRASRHLMLAYDADEIPPGLLSIGGLAGKASTRAVEDLENMAGADHKLRVITTNNPQGLDVKWTEFRRSVKDLDLKDLVKEVRRTIWRLVGVKPVTMGDTEATPRATAEVQLDAEGSGLILPILELLQAQMNTRVIPLLVGAEFAPLVAFRFNMDRDNTADENELEAKADASDFDRGGITINELREKRGRLPLEGGDVALIKSGGRYVLLSSVLNEEEAEGPSGFGGGDGDEDGAEDDEDGSGGSGEVSGESEDAAGPDEGEEAPGESERVRHPFALGAVRRPKERARKARPRKLRGCSCGHHRSEPAPGIQLREGLLLPSEWQPEGKFKGVRSMSLERLGDVLIDYQRTVEPLYQRAKLDVEAYFNSYLSDDVISESEATALASQIGRTLSKLSDEWALATRNHYRDASRIGRDAAVDFTRDIVVEDWRARGDAYHDRAMSYLSESGGLISDLRAQLLVLASASNRNTRAGAMLRDRMAQQVGEARAEEAATIATLAAVAKVWERHRHRIKNWTGRLVEVANKTLLSGMREVEPPAADEGGGRGDEWMAEWVSVGGKRTCSTCEEMSARGFSPLSSFPTEPGGDTECRGRCRCVFVFWLRSEVEGGTAKVLSNAEG